jgi:hypothetical protein
MTAVFVGNFQIAKSQEIGTILLFLQWSERHLKKLFVIALLCICLLNEELSGYNMIRVYLTLTWPISS